LNYRCIKKRITKKEGIVSGMRLLRERESALKKKIEEVKALKEKNAVLDKESEERKKRIEKLKTELAKRQLTN
jgi:predicted RNase H-like nuclease (RuvC/YqgF family)